MKFSEAWRVLTGRRFGWYYLARLISMTGSTMAPVALTFAVLEINNKASDLGLVLAARMVPMIILLLVGGVIADRFSRTMVMQVSHLLTGLTQGLAAVLVISGHATIANLVVIEAANGAVSAFSSPAMMGLVPQLVDRTDLQQANALLSFSRAGVAVVGPAVATVLVVTTSPGWGLAVDALTYFIAIAFLALVRLPRGEKMADSLSMIHELREGWSEFTSRTWLWLVVVAFCVLNAILAGAWSVLGPVISKATPEVGIAGWGAILSAEAAGILVLTIVMLKVRFRYPLRVGMLGVLVQAAPMLVLGIHPQVILLVVLAFIAGGGSEIFGLGWSLALQEQIPLDRLSRVSSYDMLGSIIAIPIGSVLFGWLGTAFPVAPVMIVSALVYAAVAGGTLLSRSVRNLRAGEPESVPAA